MLNQSLPEGPSEEGSEVITVQISAYHKVRWEKSEVKCMGPIARLGYRD